METKPLIRMYLYNIYGYVKIDIPVIILDSHGNLSLEKKVHIIYI